MSELTVNKKDKPKVWPITALKHLFGNQQTTQTDMTTNTIESTPIKPETDGRISIRADGKVWHTNRGIHQPDINDEVHLLPDELASVRIFAWDASTFARMKEQQSFFGGRLIRWHEGNWTWIDGTQETHAKDRTLKASCPDFIEDHYSGLVEVPVYLAVGFNDLRWVVDGNYEKKPADLDPNFWNQDYSPGPFARAFLPGENPPEVYLVPTADWETHSREALGVTWAPSEEHLIFEKAKSLGWVEGDPI